MLNQAIIVGRLIEINEERKTIVVKSESKEETAFIPVTLPSKIYNNLKDYCRVDDILGIKGTLKTNDNQELIVVANKITFLTSKSNRNKEE